MPNRMLYASLIGSRKVNQLKPLEFELYVRLILTVDDYGRYLGSAVRVSRACWPDREDMTSRIVEPLLERLHNVGLIQLYEDGGERYLQMTNWNQRTRADASRFPQPPDECPTNDGHMTVIGRSSAHVDVDVDVDVDDRRRRSSGELFNRFWDAYPKKVAKVAAEKAFSKISPNEFLLSDILMSIEQWKRTAAWTKDGGQYIPNAATWLNGRRWEDEIPKPAMSEAERIMSL